MIWRSRLATLVATGVLALGLSACSSSPGSTTPTTSLQSTCNTLAASRAALIHSIDSSSATTASLTTALNQFDKQAFAVKPDLPLHVAKQLKKALTTIPGLRQDLADGNPTTFATDLISLRSQMDSVLTSCSSLSG